MDIYAPCLAFELPGGVGQLVFSVEDAVRTRSLAGVFAHVSADDLRRTLDSVGAAQISRAQFDAIIRELSPDVASLPRHVRLHLSEILSVIWEALALFVPLQSGTPLQNRVVPVADVFMVLLALCQGSKSAKLSVVWDMLGSDGKVTDQALYQYMSRLLLLLFTLSSRTEDVPLYKLKEQIEDAAVEAVEAIFARLDVSGQRACSLEEFAAAYNGGAAEELPFLELLDVRKWPVPSEAEVPAAKEAVVPLRQAAAPPVPSAPPVETKKGQAAPPAVPEQAGAVMELPLTGPDGAVVQWRIAPAQVEQYQRFLSSSRLPGLSCAAVLRALLAECAAGQVTPEEATAAVAALMGAASAFDEGGSTTEEDSDGPSARQVRMRVVVTTVRSLLSCLTRGQPGEGVDLIDITMAMLPYCAGDKSEKLAFAWRLLESDATDGRLDQDSVVRMLRSLLLGLLAATFPAEGQGQAEWPEAIPNATAVQLYDVASASAEAVSSHLYSSLGRSGSGPGVSLPDLGSYYNTAGAGRMAWLELLNSKKWAGVKAGKPSVVPPPVPGAAARPQAPAAPIDARLGRAEQPALSSPPTAPSQAVPDLAIEAVEGADVVFTFLPSPSTSHTVTGRPLRFSTLACDVVQHVAAVTGLADKSAGDVMDTVHATVYSKSPETLSSATGVDGYGRHLIPRPVFNEAVKALVPGRSLDKDDRLQLSRFLGRLFDTLDHGRVGVVDWRDVALALSLFAGSSSKSSKLERAFRLYGREDRDKGEARLSKDGVFRMLRTMFSCLACIQEAGSELDLALGCVLTEQERGLLPEGLSSPSDLVKAPAEQVLQGGRLPDGRRVALRTSAQRLSSVLSSAQSFAAHVFSLAGEQGVLDGDGRAITFSQLAAVYDKTSASSDLHFLELLSLRKWRPSSSMPDALSMSPSTMRLLLAYAAARPLVYAALLSESAASEEDEEAEAQQAETGSPVSAQKEARGDKEELNARLAYEQARLAEDEAALAEAEEELQDAEDALTAAQAMNDAMAAAIGRPVFEFRLPRASASNDGSPGPMAVPFVLTAMDSAALQKALHFGRLDSYEPGQLRDMLVAAANGNNMISRFAWVNFASRLAGANDNGVEMTERVWTQAALHTVFNCFDRPTEREQLYLEPDEIAATPTAPVRDLAAALFVLCGGDKTSALSAAWSLFDGNKDGRLTEAELTLMLRAYITMLFVIKTWSSMPVDDEGLALPHAPPVLSQAARAAIGDVALKLGEAAFAECRRLETSNPSSRPSSDVSVHFNTFGFFYNSLTAKNQQVPSRLPGDGAITREAFLWLELLDVRKWPTTDQVSASVQEAGRAAAEAAVVELSRQRAVDRAMQEEEARQRAQDAADAREAQQQGGEASTDGESQEYAPGPGPSAGVDPVSAGYQPLRDETTDGEQEEEDNEEQEEGQDEEEVDTSVPASGRPLFTFTLAPSMSGLGLANLTVTDVDCYAFARLCAAWPLPEASASDLVAILADAADSSGRISRPAFEGLVDELCDARADDVLAQASGAVEEKGDTGRQARVLLRMVIRDLRHLRDTLMRMYDLLDMQDEGQVDGEEGNVRPGISVLDLLLPLLLFTTESKSSKLRDSWALYGGQGSGPMTRLELASFLSCLLRGFCALTSVCDIGVQKHGDLRAVKRATVVACINAADNATLQAQAMRVLQSEEGHPGVEGLSFAEFASWYNGGTAQELLVVLPDEQDTMRPGSKMLPWLELLSPHKWVPSASAVPHGQTGHVLMDPGQAHESLQSLLAHVAKGREAGNHPFYSVYAATVDMPGQADDQSQPADADQGSQTASADVPPDIVTEQDAVISTTGQTDEDEQASLARDDQPPGQAPAQEQPEDEEEAEETSPAEDDVQFGFQLGSTGYQLTLTRPQVASFLRLVHTSSLGHIKPEEVFAAVARAVDGSRGGQPTLSFRAYTRMTAQLLLSATQRAERGPTSPGGRMVDVRSVTDELYRLYEACDDGPKGMGGHAEAMLLATGLLLLVGTGLRKSDKLLAAWRAFSTESSLGPAEDSEGEDPRLSTSAFSSFLAGVLLGLGIWGTVEGQDGQALALPQARDIIRECADELAQVMYGQEDVVAFGEFATWYNDRAGSSQAGFLELLDGRKWTAQVSSPSVSGSSKGAVTSPATAPPQVRAPAAIAAPVAPKVASPPPAPPAAARTDEPSQGPVDARAGSARKQVSPPRVPAPTAPQDPVLLTFELPADEGATEATAPLVVKDSDVAHLKRVRILSNLRQLNPSQFLAAVQGAGLKGRVSDGAARLDKNDFRQLVRVLVPGDSPAMSSDPSGRSFLTKSLTTLFYMLGLTESQGSSRGVAEAGVPLGDVAVGLLPLVAGSKSDKLLAAWRLMDGDGDEALTEAEFARLLRCVLAGLLTFRSEGHISSESAGEKRLAEVLPSLTRHLSHAAFLTCPSTREGRMSFTDFGAWYNQGGYSAVPFLECLDFKKLAGAKEE